jgi:hypothetical protein
MAAQQTKAPAGKAPFLQGSVIWQKKGPLPVWAWAIIGLALVFIIMWWRRNQQASTDPGFYRDELPGDQGAPPIFIVPQAPVSPVTILPAPPATVPTAPPGGGSAPPMALPTQLTAPANKNLYEWIDEVNRANPGLEFNFGKLDLYNPGWRNSGLVWSPTPGNPSAKTPTLTAPRSFRVR